MERNASMASIAIDVDVDQDTLARIVRLRLTNVRTNLVLMEVFALMLLQDTNAIVQEDTTDLDASRMLTNVAMNHAEMVVHVKTALTNIYVSADLAMKDANVREKLMNVNQILASMEVPVIDTSTHTPVHVPKDLLGGTVKKTLMIAS